MFCSFVLPPYLSPTTSILFRISLSFIFASHLLYFYYTMDLFRPKNWSLRGEVGVLVLIKFCPIFFLIFSVFLVFSFLLYLKISIYLVITNAIVVYIFHHMNDCRWLERHPQVQILAPPLIQTAYPARV